jgi:hypothetical protein
MTARYAENTSVPADRSRAEIERTLERYGARQFMYGRTEEQSVVAFVCEVATASGERQLRQVRFVIPMPDKTDPSFTHTPTGKRRRDPEAMLKEYERATRQRWRALALVIKAKLEAVESGITEFEDEFMAHLVLPDGSTVSEFMRPQIETAYEKGVMPKLVLALPEKTS